MYADFSIIDRVRLAFAVMMHWEILATLAAFIALWLLMSYVADPWRAKSRKAGPRIPRPRKAAKVKAPLPETGDEEVDLPD